LFTLDVGMVRTVFLYLSRILKKLMKHFLKINANERSLILTFSHCQYFYEYQI